MNKNFQTVRLVPQDIIRTSADNDARALLRKLRDDLALRNPEDILIGRTKGAAVKPCPNPSRRRLFGVMDILLVKSAFPGDPANEFAVIACNSQFFRNFLADRPAAAAENWCHVVGPVRESILLIEGYMKADIVHHFTGQTVIAIPGVTSIRHLKLVLDELIGLGVRHVMTCFDMDYLKNWHVDEANQNLTLMLGCLPITFGTYLWVPDYNGLDDYIWEFCLERRQPQS